MWVVEMDAAMHFIEECVEPDPFSQTHVKDLVAAYRHWASVVGAPNMGHRALSLYMYMKGFKKMRERNGRTFWVGVRLK